jgi:hypothetical protein
MVVLASTAIALIASCAPTQKAPETAHEPPPVQLLEPDVAEEEMEPGPQPAEPEIFFTHTVKWTGESLSIIAAWYTGELENWKLLALANPELNPNLIRIGDEIRIPESLMITTDTMTFDFVSKYVPSLKKGRSESPAPAPEQTRVSEEPSGGAEETPSAEEEPVSEAGEVTSPVDEADEVASPVDEAEQAEINGAEDSDSAGAEAEEMPKEDEDPELFGPKSFD